DQVDVPVACLGDDLLERVAAPYLRVRLQADPFGFLPQREDVALTVLEQFALHFLEFALVEAAQLLAQEQVDHVQHVELRLERVRHAERETGGGHRGVGAVGGHQDVAEHAFRHRGPPFVGLPAGLSRVYCVRSSRAPPARASLRSPAPIAPARGSAPAPRRSRGAGCAPAPPPRATPSRTSRPTRPGRRQPPATCAAPCPGSSASPLRWW